MSDKEDLDSFSSFGSSIFQDDNDNEDNEDDNFVTHLPIDNSIIIDAEVNDGDINHVKKKKKKKSDKNNNRKKSKKDKKIKSATLSGTENEEKNEKKKNKSKVKENDNKRDKDRSEKKKTKKKSRKNKNNDSIVDNFMIDDINGGDNNDDCGDNNYDIHRKSSYDHEESDDIIMNSFHVDDNDNDGVIDHVDDNDNDGVIDHVDDNDDDGVIDHEGDNDDDNYDGNRYDSDYSHDDGYDDHYHHDEYAHGDNSVAPSMQTRKTVRFNEASTDMNLMDEDDDNGNDNDIILNNNESINTTTKNGFESSSYKHLDTAITNHNSSSTSSLDDNDMKTNNYNNIAIVATTDTAAITSASATNAISSNDHDNKEITTTTTTIPSSSSSSSRLSLFRLPIRFTFSNRLTSKIFFNKVATLPVDQDSKSIIVPANKLNVLSPATTITTTATAINTSSTTINPSIYADKRNILIPPQSTTVTATQDADEGDIHIERNDNMHPLIIEQQNTQLSSIKDNESDVKQQIETLTTTTIKTSSSSSSASKPTIRIEIGDDDVTPMTEDDLIPAMYTKPASSSFLPKQSSWEQQLPSLSSPHPTSTTSSSATSPHPPHPSSSSLLSSSTTTTITNTGKSFLFPDITNNKVYPFSEVNNIIIGPSQQLTSLSSSIESEYRKSTTTMHISNGNSSIQQQQHQQQNHNNYNNDNNSSSSSSSSSSSNHEKDNNYRNSATIADNTNRNGSSNSSSRSSSINVPTVDDRDNISNPTSLVTRNNHDNVKNNILKNNNINKKEVTTIEEEDGNGGSSSSNIQDNDSKIESNISTDVYCDIIKTTTFLNAIKFAQGKSPKVLCASADSSVHIYSVTDGTRYPSLEGHTDRVISLAVSNPFFSIDPSNQNNSIMRTLVVSGSRDEYLRIWELDTAKCLHAIHAHKSPIWSVGIVVRSNGNVIVVSTAADGTMRSWNGKSGEKLINFKGHTDKILSVFILNPLTDYPLLLSGGADKKLRVWELLTGAHIRMMEGHDDEITSIVAGTYTGISSLVVTSNNDTNDGKHNDGKVTIIVSGCRDLTVRVWDFNTGHLIYELLGHTGCVYQVALVRANAIPTVSSSSSSKVGINSKIALGKPIIISCSEDASVRLWDVTNGKQIKKLKWHKVSVRGVDVMTMVHNNNVNLHNNSHHHHGISLIATCGWDKNIQIHELQNALNSKEESYCEIS